MEESSGSQFFRTTSGIKAGPDAFDKSRLIMTFLNILGVTEVFCSFKLVLEQKTRKEIPESSRLEFLEKFSTNNCALSDAEDNTFGPPRYSRFTFVENTISNFQKVLRANFLGSKGLLCFISICKFGSFKKPFAMMALGCLSEIYFRITRFIILVQTKKVISMSYGSSTCS